MDFAIGYCYNWLHNQKVILLDMPSQWIVPVREINFLHSSSFL